MEKGEPLFELDTDKVTQEVEAEAAGVLLKIAVPEGEVPGRADRRLHRRRGRGRPRGRDRGAAQGRSAKPSETEPAPASEAPAGGSGRVGNGRIKASPLARRHGAGARHRALRDPRHRPRRADRRRGRRARRGGRAGRLRCAAPAPAPLGEVERVPLTNIRKTIARRLTEAWQIPVFQLQASADMTRVNALVAKLRERDPEVRVTVTDVLTKVCAQALMRHREVNAEFTEDAILLHPSANVGLAVAAPQGLVVPVIRSAERLLADRDRRRARATSSAGRARTSSAPRTSRAARSRSRTSACTRSRASPRCSTRRRRRSWPSARPRSASSRSAARRPCARWSRSPCTFDHRAVDGAPAAAFLQTLKESLEDPGLAL